MNVHPTDAEPISLAEHSYFYSGMEYIVVDGRTLSQGGMYIEKFVPLKQSSATPVVMMHGFGQTGANFIGTPDGRRGWLHDFLRAGYTVYVVDQPARGRSGHSLLQIQGGSLFVEDVKKIENYLTATGNKQLWPQAKHHTQWPGSGQMGDPVFDQFYASQVNGLSDRTRSEQLVRDACVQLLDNIGPAILLTHSQAGSIGWLIADARPGQVKALLSVEPNGPPFFDVKYGDRSYTGQHPWYEFNTQQIARPYGITRAPLTFNPPLAEGEFPEFELQTTTSAPEMVTGYLQTEPARQLPNLQGIPIVILIAQASYHAPYDHLTSAFLRQAGVDHELVYLEHHGCRGNGHMVMLEKNNHQVADFMIDWLRNTEQVRSGSLQGG